MKPNPFCALKNLTTPLPAPTTCAGMRLKPPPPPAPPPPGPPCGRPPPAKRFPPPFLSLSKPPAGEKPSRCPPKGSKPSSPNPSRLSRPRRRPLSYPITQHVPCTPSKTNCAVNGDGRPPRTQQVIQLKTRPTHLLSRRHSLEMEPRRMI